MKIHLISSMRKFDEDVKVIYAIADIIHKHNSNIAFNWFDGVSDRKTRGFTSEASLDWPALVEDNMNAIKHCDAVIVEGSRFNFSQGYQTAIALQYKKPVLNLYRDDSEEYKEWPDKFYVSGIFDPFFTSKSYRTIEEACEITAQFLKENESNLHELDVKFAIDNEIYEKIEQLSQKSGRSKASIVKDALSHKFKSETELTS
jgi:hypothetical protein